MTLSIRPSSISSRKSQLLLILIVMLHWPYSLSFVVLPSTQRTPFPELSQKRIHEYPSTSDSLRSSAIPPLFAAKRSGGPGPKSKKKKKNSSAGGAKPKGQQNDKRHSKSASSPKKQQKSSPKKAQSSTPPWQVMSAKEAKKNIEHEKERRKLAQQGIHQPTGPSLDVSEQFTTKTLSKSFLSESDQRFLKWKRFNPSNTPNLGLRMVGAYLDRRLPPSLGVPEVAFLGRSNVGKSSLLNRLTTTSTSASSSTQARVGKTPGATASVNLYALAKYKTTAGSTTTTASSSSSSNNNHNDFKDLLGLADLPGFGYAKLSKDLQESVQEAAENYLGKRRELALGILLVDVRRAISDNDRAVLAALYDMGVPLLVVATKIDKLKNDAERTRHLQAIQQGLGLPEGQPLAISSVTGEGVKPLWSIILEACETSVWEFRKTYDDSAAAELENADDEYAPGEASLLDGDEDDEEELAYDMGYDWIHGGDFGVYEDDEDGADDFYDGNLDYDENNPPSSDGDWFADEDEYSTNNMVNPNAPRSGETMKSLKQRARDMERRGEV